MTICVMEEFLVCTLQELTAFYHTTEINIPSLKLVSLNLFKSFLVAEYVKLSILKLPLKLKKYKNLNIYFSDSQYSQNFNKEFSQQ